MLAAAATAPLVAIGLYALLGSPGSPDQPYRHRLAAWRAADPSTLDPPRMAAVVGAIVTEHPGKVLPLYYLAQAQLAAGEPYQAEHSLRQALALAPKRADLWTALGELLTAEAQGEPTAASATAFERARALDPKAPIPRYNLAMMQIRNGDVAGGLATLRALSADIPPTDPARKDLDGQIAQIQRTGALPPPQAAGPDVAAPPAGQPGAGAPVGGDQQAFIRAMVDRPPASAISHPPLGSPQGFLCRRLLLLPQPANFPSGVHRVRARTGVAYRWLVILDRGRRG